MEEMDKAQAIEEERVDVVPATRADIATSQGEK
jgi:hypothetical protein